MDIAAPLSFAKQMHLAFCDPGKNNAAWHVIERLIDGEQIDDETAGLLIFKLVTDALPVPADSSRLIRRFRNSDEIIAFLMNRDHRNNHALGHRILLETIDEQFALIEKRLSHDEPATSQPRKRAGAPTLSPEETYLYCAGWLYNYEKRIRGLARTRSDDERTQIASLAVHTINDTFGTNFKASTLLRSRQSLYQSDRSPAVAKMVRQHHLEQRHDHLRNPVSQRPAFIDRGEPRRRMKYR